MSRSLNLPTGRRSIACRWGRSSISPPNENLEPTGLARACPNNFREDRKKRAGAFLRQARTYRLCPALADRVPGPYSSCTVVAPSLIPKNRAAVPQLQGSAAENQVGEERGIAGFARPAALGFRHRHRRFLLTIRRGAYAPRRHYLLTFTVRLFQRRARGSIVVVDLGGLMEHVPRQLRIWLVSHHALPDDLVEPAGKPIGYREVHAFRHPLPIFAVVR